jgi:Polysaccharide biosynthesis protein.
MITSVIPKKYRVQNLTHILLNREESGSLRNHLIRGTTGTFGLKVAVTGMYFIISLLLARLLGSAGYGNYAYAISWAVVLGVPAGMGLNRLLVRNISAYQTQSARGLMAGLLRWANRTALLASLGIASLSAVVLWFLRTNLDSQMLYPLWVALILLPLTALMSVRQAAMQGLNHVVVGQLPGMLFLAYFVSSF